MQEHKLQDTTIISVISLSMILLVLLLFGKLAQAEPTDRVQDVSGQSVNIDYKIPDLAELDQIDYHAYNSGDTRIVSRFFSN